MIRSLLFSSTFVPIFRTTRTSPSNFLGFHCLPFSATARFTLVSVLHCPGIGVRNPASFCSNSLSVSAKPTLFMEEVPAANEVQLVEVLDATNDDHGGVLVEMDKAMDSEVFVPILRASISHWKQQGKKGVWLKLPIELANLVEAVVKGEDICKAAEREVREETGWMKFEDYTAQPLLQKHEVWKCINNICVTKIQQQYSGFSPVLTSTAFSSKQNFLYLNEHDMNRRLFGFSILCHFDFLAISADEL
ncbi:Nudix hydrolase 7 [Cucurbita argyrosperma subsp. argyrosperma]|nr:Nudix hydrolase 7 [Cucurbita argyrosperma subsp. argyrosperma]